MRESLEFLLANLEAFIVVIGGTLICQFVIHYCVTALRRWWASTEPQPESDPITEYDDDHGLIPDDDEDDPSDIDDPTDVWPESPEDLPNEFPDMPEMPVRQQAWGSRLDPVGRNP